MRWRGRRERRRFTTKERSDEDERRKDDQLCFVRLRYLRFFVVNSVASVPRFTRYAGAHSARPAPRAWPAATSPSARRVASPHQRQRAQSDHPERNQKAPTPAIVRPAPRRGLRPRCPGSKDETLPGGHFEVVAQSKFRKVMRSGARNLLARRSRQTAEGLACSARD